MDAREFNAAIVSLSDKLFRLARSILQNTEEAEDALQDLSLKLWEKREYLDEVENMQAFSLRAMRNHCLDEIRKRRPVDELPSEMEGGGKSPHQLVETQDMAHKVRLMIDQLPELQRTVIRMRDVEGLEISEIAHITSLTENAVTVNLSRARQKIREKMKNEHKYVEGKVWK